MVVLVGRLKRRCDRAPSIRESYEKNHILMYSKNRDEYTLLPPWTRQRFVRVSTRVGILFILFVRRVCPSLLSILVRELLR